MKKVLLFTLIFAVGFLSVACRQDTEEGIRVGLIVSSAGANDNGYNEFAIQGLNQAKADFDIDIQVVTTAEDVPGSLEILAEEGYDLIFSLEYNFAALIEDDGSGRSIAEKFPDTMFVIFNDFANTDGDGNKIHDNVIEVLFNVNEASFLAGALAVLVNEAHEVLFTDAKYDFSPLEEDLGRAVGFVGGSQSPGIQVFSWGFYQGVNHIAAELDVQYRFYETYAAGFGASAANATTINNYFDNGANVIFAAAGGVATNLRNAAVSKGKLAVDVDADQDAAAPGHVLTSVLKNTNVPVYTIIEEFINGTLEGGKDLSYDLTSEGTGITELVVIAEHIADTPEAAEEWANILLKISELYDAIVAGTIDVIDAQYGEVLDYETLTHLTKAN